MATKKKDEVEPRPGPHDSSSRVYTEPGAKPAADVSNLDVNMAEVSLDAAHATVELAPEQNPEDLVPPPGVQHVQVLGHQSSLGGQSEPVGGDA